MYRISYLWYSLIGCFVTIVVGLFTSFCTGCQDPREMNQDLISPAINNFFDKLSNEVKESLNLPLKTAPSKTIRLSGIANPTLDLADELKKPEMVSKPVDESTNEASTETSTENGSTSTTPL